MLQNYQLFYYLVGTHRLSALGAGRQHGRENFEAFGKDFEGRGKGREGESETGSVLRHRRSCAYHA